MRPKLYELCDVMAVEESGNSKHLQTLMMTSRMVIKKLFLVGDTDLFPHAECEHYATLQITTKYL